VENVIDLRIFWKLLLSISVLRPEPIPVAKIVEVLAAGNDDGRFEIPIRAQIADQAPF
jgi:hypothetical protein